MDFSKFMNAPKTVAGNPAPPIPPTVEKNLPYFSYFSQVVQPLVFDNSLSFYEVCTRLAAAVNNNILQINQLTGAMKEFMEYMVKWGTELNAEWEEYKTDLTGKWEAYQAELNRQWNEYKTTLTAEWLSYQTNLTNEWNTFRDDYREEWEQFKQSINGTIEKNVGDWLTENAEPIINEWLKNNISLWIEVDGTVEYPNKPSQVTIKDEYCKVYYNPALKMYQLSFMIGLVTSRAESTIQDLQVYCKFPHIGYALPNSFIFQTAFNTIYWEERQVSEIINQSRVYGYMCRDGSQTLELAINQSQRITATTTTELGNTVSFYSDLPPK